MSDKTDTKTDDPHAVERELAERKARDAKSSFTVTAPHRGFNGEIGGVQFTNGKGVARGDNYAALGYFRSNGYDVTSGGDVDDDDDVEPAEEVDRRTARDALKHPDEAVSWGARRSAADYVDDTPELNGFGEDGKGRPYGAGPEPRRRRRPGDTDSGSSGDAKSDSDAKAPASPRAAAKPTAKA